LEDIFKAPEAINNFKFFYWTDETGIWKNLPNKLHTARGSKLDCSYKDDLRNQIKIIKITTKLNIASSFHALIFSADLASPIDKHQPIRHPFYQSPPIADVRPHF
jgi:hypothetical protein